MKLATLESLERAQRAVYWVTWGIVAGMLICGVFIENRVDSTERDARRAVRANACAEIHHTMRAIEAGRASERVGPQ